MRDPNEILDLFKDLESKVNINELVYKKNNIWPVFRLKWGFNILYNKNPPKFRKFPKESFWRRIYQIPYLIFKICFYFIKFVFSLPKLKNKNWFLVPEQVLFVDTVKNKKYCRYLDPYYEFFQENNLTVERITFKTMESSPCTGSDYFHQASILKINHLQKVYYCLQKLRMYFGKYKKDISQTKSLILSISSKAIPAEKKNLSLSYYNVFEEVNLYDFCFSTLFKFCTPKNILFTCYYSEMKMGLIAAANKYNINTVDIQHGVVEDFMYIPFTKNVKEQNLLPNYLWCWSNSDVNTIKSFNENSSKLVPLKLGNLWYKKVKEKNETIPQNYIEIRKRVKKIVLITLQHQIGYQEIFHKIITKFNEDWWVLVRFHPLMNSEDRMEYTRALANIKNVDFNCNDEMNLFQCFQLADINLTHSSTTSIEALNFNLQSILVDKIGYAYYKDKVDKGVLLYSEDPEEIKSLILNTKSNDFSKIYKDYLIDIKNEDLIKKLETILVQ